MIYLVCVNVVDKKGTVRMFAKCPNREYAEEFKGHLTRFNFVEVKFLDYWLMKLRVKDIPKNESGLEA